MSTNTWGSYERRKDCVPAYWVTEFGVLKETKIEGCHPLYWKREPLSKAELKACWGDPETLNTQALIDYARAIEAKHGIRGTDE
jgi:hypothetical protein